MNDIEIERVIESLDKEVPQDGAKVRFFQYGGGPDESAIHANKIGYLRLGIEFLKAAFAPQEKSGHPNAIKVSLDYLCDPESDVSFNAFERQEDLKTEPHVETFKNKLIGYCFLSIFIISCCLAIIGIFTVVRWVF